MGCGSSTVAPLGHDGRPLPPAPEKGSVRAAEATPG